MNYQIEVLDTTLRDGAQAEGVSFSCDDKFRIAMALDRLGITYIEGGNPASNPKDKNFYDTACKLPFKNARLTAFGSTRKKDSTVENDSGINALLESGVEVLTIFGKCWDLHVDKVLQTTLEENLQMIYDTVRYLSARGKTVIFDAEHFFDGYVFNTDYALESARVAVEAGASCLVLCDTNGSVFPDQAYTVVNKVVHQFDVPVGVHFHNDCGLAVANTMAAVKAGAVHIQGTLIGFGERCGNANLGTIIANLQLKSNIRCIAADQMVNLAPTARMVAEIANIKMNEADPYTGNSAFAHKGGMHVDGVLKEASSFEHIDPQTVGNKRRFLLSEVSGKRAIQTWIHKIDPAMSKDAALSELVIGRLKELENEGYQFEGAESSLELVVRKCLNNYKPFFELVHYKIIGEHPPTEERSTCSLVKIKVEGKEEIASAEGTGPVHALDKALRRALEIFYPVLKEIHLSDYKVRVVNPAEATGAKVRVLIESTDGIDVWHTVGVSTDIIEASFYALADSIEYKLMKHYAKMQPALGKGEL